MYSVTTPPVRDITVVYTTGWCRSGTTVLGNILNEVEGWVHVGELHFLWSNGVLGTGTNELCGCGQRLRECSVWSSVLAAHESATGMPLERIGRDVERWQERAFRTRHTFGLLRPEPAALCPGAETAGYLDSLARTYHAIAAATGASVVVDSSKYASEAALLGRMPGVRPAIVHMVRDPRGVAASWAKPKGYMPARGPADSTLHWIGFNLAAEAVNARYRDRSLTLRYEDFMAEPQASVERVLRLGGGGANPVAGDTVTLGSNHTVTGNPDRFATGTVRLRRDDRWRTRLPRRDAALVAAIGGAMMLSYGYMNR